MVNFPCCKTESEPEQDVERHCDPACDKGQKHSKLPRRIPVTSKRAKSGNTSSDNSSPDATKGSAKPEVVNIYAKEALSCEQLMTYVFRMPIRSGTHMTGVRNANVKCPPFHLQLDHTLAVLWCLFAADSKGRKQNLGISQLQWALYFLRGIKINNKHLPDVAIAIHAIEDNLIDCYADMSNLVLNPKLKPTECLTCDLSRTLPRSKCGICTSASLAVEPRKRKSVQPDVMGMTSVARVTQLPSNMGSFLPPVSSTPYEDEGVQTSGQSQALLRNDIRELKYKAAALATSMEWSSSRDTLISLMQTWQSMNTNKKSPSKNKSESTK